MRLSDLASFGFAVAHHCERPVEAAAYLRQLGGDPDALITYPLYGVDKRWAPGAAAAAGEAALTPILAGVNADVAAGRYDEAIAKLTSFETGDAFVQMHLADRVKLAEWKRDFEAGRTLDLIGGGLAGWRPLNGNWSFDAEAKAVVAGFYGGNLRNVVGQPLGNRYELDLVVEVPEEWCQLEWTGVGFTWGYEPALATRRHPFAFAAGARGGSTWVSDPELAAGERSSIQPASRGPVISVRVRRDRQTVSIWTGDPGDPPDAFDRPADHVHRFAAPLEEGLGLSGYSQGNAAVTVRVTKLTVKKLDA